MIIAGAIVMVLGGVGAVIVQVINAMAASHERREARASRIKLEALAEAGDTKNNEIIKQGVAIHTLTNSSLSKVTADLATANVTIKSLERMIDGLVKAKDIADALATHTASAKEEPKVLSDIKENTANTVEAVKDLKNGN